MHGRDARRDAGDLGGDVVAARGQDRGELRAFAGAGGGELGERLVDEGQRPGGERLGVDGGLGEDAGPAQDLVHRQRRGLRHLPRHVRGGRGQGRHPARVDREARGAGRGPVEAEPQLHLAPPELAGELLAERRLERSELVGEPEREVEVAVVDAAELGDERRTGELRGSRREAGHAEDHRGFGPDFDTFSGFTGPAGIGRM